MKNRKLLVRVSCTNKDFYLSKPHPAADWHIRFTPPRAVRDQLHISERVNRTTGCAEIAPAIHVARRIIEEHWTGARAASVKAREELATIGEIIAAYQQQAKERPRTLENNSRALRTIVRAIYPGTPETKPASVLTSDLVRKFEASRLTASTTDAGARQRAQYSIASYLRQARSIVSPNKAHFYADLKLPDLSGFRSQRVTAPRHSMPRPLDMQAMLSMEAAAPQLAETDPGAYVAHLLFTRLGLRNIEIAAARKTWITDGRIGIIDRPEEDFYPKGCEGWIPLDPQVLLEVLRFQLMCTGGYLVPGANKTERHNAIYRRHSQWVSQWIKGHRKTSYELRRYAGSRLLDKGADILDVRDFLRHRDVQTTQQWYLYRLQNRKLPTIGMNDLLPQLEVVTPDTRKTA